MSVAAAAGAVHPRGNRLGRAEMWAIQGLGTMALLAAWLQPLWGGRLQVHCPLWVLSGWPCPTCGGTRALVAAASGRWADALAWNPAVGVLGIALLFLVPLGAAWLASGRPGPRIPTGLSPGARWGVGVLFAAHWGYLCMVFAG